MKKRDVPTLFHYSRLDTGSPSLSLEASMFHEEYSCEVVWPDTESSLQIILPENPEFMNNRNSCTCSNNII